MSGDKEIHLGDGAYVSITPEGDVCFTANHHDLSHATDAVYVERSGVESLIRFLSDNFTGEEEM